MENYRISNHAWERFWERGSAQSVHLSLTQELQNSIPYGEPYNDELYRLLPCGLVAVCKVNGRLNTVVTILTVEQAVSNIGMRRQMSTTVSEEDSKIFESIPAKTTPSRVRHASNKMKERIRDLCRQFQINVDRERMRTLTVSGYCEWEKELIRYRGKVLDLLARRETLSIIAAFHAVCAIPSTERSHDLENESVTDRGEIEEYRLAYRSSVMAVYAVFEMLKRRAESCPDKQNFVREFLESIPGNPEQVVETLDKYGQSGLCDQVEASDNARVCFLHGISAIATLEVNSI